MMAGLRPCTRLLLLAARRYPIPALSGSLSCSSRSDSHSCTHPVLTTSLANQMACCRHMTSGPNREAPGPSTKAKANGRRLQVLTGAWTALLGACYILYRQLNAKEKGEESTEAEPEDKVCSLYRNRNRVFIVWTAPFIWDQIPLQYQIRDWIQIPYKQGQRVL